MERTILMKRLVLSAIVSALACTSPWAEEIEHHGVMADSESSAYECLSCHDGQIAKQIHTTDKLGRYLCTHPINRDYPPADKRTEYLPLETVTAAGIKLLQGQITCISCHNLKNPEKPHLVEPLDKSDLCFNCHRL